MKLGNEKQVQKEELAIARVSSQNQGNTKEYIEHTKKLLEDFKMMQSVILNAPYQEVPVLIRVAQSNLTKACVSQIDDIIHELQLNFSEKSINLFIEKSISIITSMDTANFIYGNIVEIKEIKKYLSSKLTKVMILRSERLLKTLKTTSFEEKGKITVIVDNLNMCIKLLDYSWDIYTKNIRCLAQSKKILESLILNRVKLGLDNYNVELLKIMIDKSSHKIELSKKKPSHVSMMEDSESQISNQQKKYDKHILVDSEVVANSINIKDIQDNNQETSLVVNNDSATDKFIEMTNNVIKEVTQSDSNDFLNVALQKFYSIINALETVNFLKGQTINKEAVTENVSNLFVDLVDRNFIAITRSWSELTNKTEEDNSAFYKELIIYKEMFTEAYNMCPKNIEALKKYVDVQLTIFNNKEVFKLTKGQESMLNIDINEKILLIKQVDSKYSPLIVTQSKPVVEKKKSWWSKIFN